MTPADERGDSARRRRVLGLADVAAISALTVLPQLLTGRGRLNADTKQPLYTDPVDLLDRARTIWDSRVGGGTVTHQAIGYLWPMGPFYAALEGLGAPDWVAQRLWVGGLQLFAGLGALALFRHLLPRSWVQVPAALLYALSPFVLGLGTTQSGLLVPYAALGWLIWLMAKSVETAPSWRWPAAFALVVTTSGSLNGSSVAFVVLAAALWVPFALAGTGRAGLRQGTGVLARAGVLTLATQLWWIVAYGVGGRFGLPVLDITETVRTTNATSSATEVLRGLGYWTFYGVDPGGPWLEGLADRYQTSVPLLVVSLAVPALALAAGAVLRWHFRAYFATLVAVGAIVSVGAFPVADPSPAGGAFEALSRNVDAVLSLRNTQRAGALVALGLAALVAAGLTALIAERPVDPAELRRGRLALRGHPLKRLLGITPDPRSRGLSDRSPVVVASAAAVVVLAAAALPAQWRAGLVADRFDRPEDLPQAWTEAARYLDQGEGRVLEVPGIDFAAHRWGYALDPVLVGLVDRDTTTRELVPTGGEPGADLLEALDRSMQEGWFEASALAPVARLLGAGDVLVRNDLEYERYRTVRPRVLWPQMTGPGTDLGPPEAFGGPYRNEAVEDLPMIDEVELALPPSGQDPPQLAVLPVPGGPRAPLSAVDPAGALVVDGDGEGVLAAAAAGLLDDVSGPLLLGRDLLDALPQARRGASDEAVQQVNAEVVRDMAGDDARYVLTDTNRKRGHRWYTLYENVGATEPAGGRVAEDDQGDARLSFAKDQPPGAQSVVVWRGAQRIWASAYGAPATLLPEDRPSNAFDGDPRTAWRSEREPPGRTRTIGIDLGRAVDADRVVLVPSTRYGSVAVTRAVVTLDGERRFDVDLTEEEARDPAGVEVELDGQTFRELTVQVLDTSPQIGRGGFAEVSIPGVEVTELVRLPTALGDATGGLTAGSPLAVVLTRLRSNPADVLRDDPEPSMARILQMPVPEGLVVSGTARVSPRASERVIDRLLGASEQEWGATATSSSRLPGDISSRASAAFDGDPATAWQTGLVPAAGQWIEVQTTSPASADSLALEVVVDQRHSTPTRLSLSVDGGPPVELDLPELEAGRPGTTRRVELELPETLVGSSWRLEVGSAVERTTTDWYTGFPEPLPVALAEVEIPGVPARPAEQAVDTGCRADLLSLGDRPVPVRIRGDALGPSGRTGMRIDGCQDVLVATEATDLRTAPGSGTGLDIDRLVLANADWSSAPVADATGPAVEVTSDGPASVSATVESTGDPFWIVLDESVNDGWDLDVEDASVDGPRAVDSYAAGWFVQPRRSGELAVRATFEPQRSVNVALALSGLGVVLCLALLVAGRRGRQQPVHGRPPPWLGLGGHGPPSWAATVGAAVAAAVLVDPIWAVPAAVAMAASRRLPILARAVPVLVIGAAFAMVVVDQARTGSPAAFGWPGQHVDAHRLAMLGLVLLLVTALADRRSAVDSRR